MNSKDQVLPPEVTDLPRPDGPTAGVTPAQIGSVTNVDAMDTHDRAKLDPAVKFQLLAAETRALTGRDPRGGGFAFVARPAIVLQIMIDCRITGVSAGDIRPLRSMIFGSRNGDVVARWCDSTPIVVRCTTADNRLHCVAENQLPDSLEIDRVRAGQIRVAIHAGRLEALREP